MSAGGRPIVIVGAGPTGLTLACLLHLAGVPCRVIDRAPAATPFSRALGMFTRSLEIMDEIGVADQAVELGHRIEQTNMYSRGRRLAAMRTSTLLGTRRATILSLPQDETERLLGERLAELGGTVERERELIDARPRPGGGPVELEIAGPDGVESLEADWLVGADGAHSAVRRLLGIEFPGRRLDDVFAIFDAFVESSPARNQVHYHLAPEGVTVACPLPDGSYRFAMSMDDYIGDGSPLSATAVAELLARRIGGGIRLERLRDAGWGAAQVRVSIQIAATFRRGRCLLVGDAAHVYGPLGGQGMNGGIQDAHNLAWKLALVSRGEAHEALLDSYATERRAISAEAARTVVMQSRLGTVAPRPAVAVRDGLIALAGRSLRFERETLRQSVMLAHRYPAGPAVAEGRDRPAGRRLPDVVLAGEDDGASRLFDLLRERPFTVLAVRCGPAEEPRLASLARELEDAYGAHRVAVTAIAECGDGLDEELGGSGPVLCLARADGVAACTCPPDAVEPLRELLHRLLVEERSMVPT